jgi:bacteriorhodopsin
MENSEKPFHETAALYMWVAATIIIVFIILLVKLKEPAKPAPKAYDKMSLTADFIGKISFSVDQYITKQVLAQGQVDVPNSFGVMMRIPYRCRFAIINEDGEIQIQKIALDE